MISDVNINDKASIGLHADMNSYMTLKGYVKVRLFDGDHNLIREEGSNQIVYLGRHRLGHIICGDGTILATEKTVNTIRVAGGAVPAGGDHLNPTSPTVNDSGLFEIDAAKIKTFSLLAPVYSTVSNTVAPTATFTKIITSAEANILVNEAGLYFGTTGPIFGHYTFGTMDLRNTTNNSIEITWQILF